MRYKVHHLTNPFAIQPSCRVYCSDKYFSRIVLFSRKLFKKAQLEALSTDLTQTAYQEIISGIQDMDDPNNFFYGLAKLNKDLKSCGERYYITGDDLVKINKAYIIDSSDLLSIGENALLRTSKSDNHLLALKEPNTNEIKEIPKSNSFNTSALDEESKSGIVFETNTPISDTIFATKYTFMIRSVHYLLENTTEHINDFVKETFRNLKDLETLTLLLKSQTDDSVKKILEVMLRFMVILPMNVNDSFSKIYPFVSLLVGALQFLLRNLEVGLLKFDPNGNNKMLSVEFCKKFTEWVDDTLDERTRHRLNPNFERKSKLRKICTDCQGFYFVFEEKVT